MQIGDNLKELIEKRFGAPIRYTSHCVALEQAIFDATGERLALTTLKRLLGFVDYPNQTRRSTLDVIARYLGYPDYRTLENDIKNSDFISGFNEIESIESSVLNPGDIVIINYEPNRRLRLEYQGEQRFVVIKSVAGKLRPGDKIKIAQLAKGFEIIATDVWRDGKSLGDYIGAKQGGITLLELLKVGD